MPFFSNIKIKSKNCVKILFLMFKSTQNLKRRKNFSVEELEEIQDFVEQTRKNEKMIVCQNSRFLNFPILVLHLVFHYLTIAEYSNLLLVCRKLNGILSAEGGSKASERFKPVFIVKPEPYRQPWYSLKGTFCHSLAGIKGSDLYRRNAIVVLQKKTGDIFFGRVVETQLPKFKITLLEYKPNKAFRDGYVIPKIHGRCVMPSEEYSLKNNLNFFDDRLSSLSTIDELLIIEHKTLKISIVGMYSPFVYYFICSK